MFSTLGPCVSVGLSGKINVNIPYTSLVSQSVTATFHCTSPYPMSFSPESILQQTREAFPLKIHNKSKVNSGAFPVSHYTAGFWYLMMKSIQITPFFPVTLFMVSWSVSDHEKSKLLSVCLVPPENMNRTFMTPCLTLECFE